MELRRQYGLDEPLFKQYINYLSSLIRFDMGLSFNTRRPVWSELKERLPNTIVLFAATFIGTATVGISLGVYAAANREKFAEKFVVGSGLFAYAVPGFYSAALAAALWLLLAHLTHPRHHECSASRGNLCNPVGPHLAFDLACRLKCSHRIWLLGAVHP